MTDQEAKPAGGGGVYVQPASLSLFSSKAYRIRMGICMGMGMA